MGVKHGNGSSDYEKYIRTNDLYALMRGPDGLANDDELLFQVTHMAMELWLATVIQHLELASKWMDEGRIHDANRFMNRATGIIEMLGGSLRHIETIRPWDYHAIRMTLGKGSGQQSPTFNRLLELVPSLLQPFQGVFARAGVTVDAVQQAPADHRELHDLTTAMLALDESFMRWRYVHYQLVQRVIGNKVLSLVGVPAAALERHAHLASFPDLWDSISRTTQAYNKIHGSPGDSGAYIVPE